MMKITAGIGAIDDYEVYINAGAKELFGGYVPFWWMEKYGRSVPLNRREVLYYNVQLGSESELEILKEAEKEACVPVTITLNAPGYPDDAYDDLLKYVRQLKRLGFHRLIVADRKLLTMLSEDPDLRLCTSGEYGELNREAVKELAQLGARRLIFPRQTTISEMESLVQVGRENGIEEFEAFVLNEKCHFTGAYCSSIHCDELCHICKVPFRLNGPEGNIDYPEKGSERDVPGETGCGLCALYRLKEAGITHLKLVSRGNDTDSTEKDIQMLAKAVQWAETAKSHDAYRQVMKKSLFPYCCSGNCYYPD